MSREQIEKMITLVEKSPKIFSTVDLIKINRTISYLSFILKDIKEFAIKKNEDGIFYEEIRHAKLRMIKIKTELFMN